MCGSENVVLLFVWIYYMSSYSKMTLIKIMCEREREREREREVIII